MPTLEILGFAPSTYTRTARMICLEKGVSHSLEPLEFRAESHRALHPFLKMPVLRHGSLVLFETLAIAVYVDTAFPGPALQPADPEAQARMFGWISAQIDYLYPALVGELAKSETPAAEALAAARDCLAVFETALTANPYVAGDTLSLADLYLAPMIAFAEAHTSGPEALRDMPGLAAWQKRIWDRPSFEATKE